MSFANRIGFTLGFDSPFPLERLFAISTLLLGLAGTMFGVAFAFHQASCLCASGGDCASWIRAGRCVGGFICGMPLLLRIIPRWTCDLDSLRVFALRCGCVACLTAIRLAIGFFRCRLIHCLTAIRRSRSASASPVAAFASACLTARGGSCRLQPPVRGWLPPCKDARSGFSASAAPITPFWFPRQRQPSPC